MLLEIDEVLLFEWKPSWKHLRAAGYPKKLSAKDWRIHKLIHRLAAAGRQAEKDNFGKSALTSSDFTPDEVTELAV